MTSFEFTDEDLDDYILHEEEGEEIENEPPPPPSSSIPETAQQRKERLMYERSQKQKEERQKSLAELAKKMKRTIKPMEEENKEPDVLESPHTFQSPQLSWDIYLQKYTSLSSKEREKVIPIIEQIKQKDILNTLDILRSTTILFQDKLALLSKSIKDSSQLLKNHPALNEARNAEKIELRALTEKPEVKEGVYTCKRCGSKKTIAREKQTRSADEPMTTKVTCQSCGLKWTIG